MCSSKQGWWLAIALLSAGALSLGAQQQPADSKAESNEELHIVGVYEGFVKTGDKIHGEKVLVEVNRPGKLVTLVFSSYNQATWEVTVKPETKIAKVILAGYHQQAVKGLPDKVEVIAAYYENNENKGTRYLTHVYKRDSPEYRALVTDLQRFTPLKVSSFHGAYAAKRESPIVIDRIVSDPKLSADYPTPTPLDQLPKLQFQAVHYTPGSHPHMMSAAFGDFTLAGPKMESLRPLPRDINKLAYDPARKQHYGLSGHDAHEVDLEKQRATKMNLGLDVPRLSWPKGLTFDTKRDRLLLMGNYIYSYAPATRTWSVLAEVGRGGELRGLVYHDRDDCLYAVGQSHGDEARPFLYKFNDKGAVLAGTRLPDVILPGMLGREGIFGKIQLVAADKYLVLMITPESHGDHGRDRVARMFLIDPTDNKAWLTWRKEME